jgi:hypothetical protein
MTERAKQMSDHPVDYFREYAPTRFHKRDGTPLKRRACQLIAIKYRLPVFQIGNTSLVYPDEADAELRKYARFGPKPDEHRGRAPKKKGRPRVMLT